MMTSQPSDNMSHGGVYGGALIPHYGPNNNYYTYYHGYYSGALPQHHQPIFEQNANRSIPEQQQSQHEWNTARRESPSQPSEVIIVTTAAVPNQTRADEDDISAAKIEVGDIPPEIIASQERLIAQATARSVVTTKNVDGIPDDVILSQERALAEIKKHPQRQMVAADDNQLQPRQHSSQLSGDPWKHFEEPSTALVVPPPMQSATYHHHSVPLTDAVHPHKYDMKKQRKRNTAAGTATGGVVGAIALGVPTAGIGIPIGAAMGAAVGGVAANKFSKAGEKRAQRKWEHAHFQDDAARSKLVEYDATYA